MPRHTRLYLDRNLTRIRHGRRTVRRRDQRRLRPDRHRRKRTDRRRRAGEVPQEAQTERVLRRDQGRRRSKFRPDGLTGFDAF